MRCITEVFRVAPILSLDSVYKGINVELVQVIHFPPMTLDNSMGNVNCVIDQERELLYTYSRNNQKEDTNYGICKISCFHIPDIRQTDVYLEDSDLIESFMIDCSALNLQGGCIKDGILYVGQGYSSVGYIYLNVISLTERRLITRVDLFGKGIRWEPEGAFWYNGSLYISSNDRNIWEISFDSEATAIRDPKI